MAVTNNNLRMVDRPVWEQLTNAPANSAAGSIFVDDNVRFIYYLISATQFWRYDTWADTWQQLASPPSGTVASATCLRYLTQMGTQQFGEVFGSVYALIASGSAVVFYRYDIATNAWSSALSVTNVPAAFGTDGRLICPEPALNGFAGDYHSNVAVNTVTASSTAAAGNTTIAVNALPLALPANAVLNFGTASAPIWAVLTSAAAASATSITVAPLVAQVTAAAVAYWYADMFLWGNNATVGYRYNIASNAWLTTSANAGNPTIAAVTAAPGAGMVTCWLPGAYDATLAPNAKNSIVLVRGAGTATIYEYNLTTNAWSTVTVYPFTDTIGSGSASALRVNAAGKNEKLLLQITTTGRIIEFTRGNARLTPKATQNLVASGAALNGDRMAVLKSIDGIEFCYFIPSTSAYFLRTPLFF